MNETDVSPKREFIELDERQLAFYKATQSSTLKEELVRLQEYPE